MDSPLYYDPYHHHDPTIIGVHTLLKPQAYQQSTYFNTPPSHQYNSPPYIPSINTHIPPAPTYPNFIANNFSHNLPRHINSVIQELHQSQRVCIQAISNLASDISKLNKSLAPPSNPYNNSTTSLTPFLYQQPLTPSNISPPNFTYQQPHITTTTTTVINHNSQHYSFPPPLKISTLPNKPLITSQIPPYNSNHVTTEIDAAKTLVSDLPIHYDPTSNAVDAQHVFVAKDFNDEAPLKLVLDLTTTFFPEVDERLREDIVTVKGQEDNHNVPPSISQSPCDFDRVESLTIQSIIDVPIGLVPVKHRSIITTRPSLLPYRFTVMTRNDGSTLFEETKQQVLNHELSVNNFERSLDFPVVCNFNFDPGGDKFSPVADSGGSRRIFSLLWLPWDRGKLGVCSFLSPASNLSHIYNTLSLLWKPLDRGKMSRKWMEIFMVPATSSCLFSGVWYLQTSQVLQVCNAQSRMKEEEAIRVNGELKSLKSSNDLMGSSYLAQSALSYLAHAA